MPRTTSGATWAPNTVTWTGNNRTHMVRVPGPGRFELRLADGAANPYLLQAASPPVLTVSAGGHRLAWRAETLNLLDALRIFDKDKALKAMLGDTFSAAYLKLKMQEKAFFGLGEGKHSRHLDGYSPGDLIQGLHRLENRYKAFGASGPTQIFHHLARLPECGDRMDANLSGIAARWSILLCQAGNNQT